MSTVVLVDDSHDIRTLVGLAINDERLSLHGSWESLEASGEHTHAVTAIVDYRLQSGIDGIEVCKKIREVNPKCKLILWTSWSRDDMTQSERDSLDLMGVHLLPKGNAEIVKLFDGLAYDG